MMSEGTPSGRLNRPPADFVTMLAAGMNHSDLARHFGIERGTVRSWAARPEVIADLADIRGDTLEAAKRKINASVETAVTTLLDVMEHGDSSSARVSAARVLMDRCLPTLTTTEMTGSLAVTDLRQLTDDALMAERAALAAKLAQTPTTGA